MKPTQQNTASAPLALHLGPDPVKTGGMASVVGQLLHLTYRGRYRAAMFPMTLSNDSSEKLWRRAFRHAKDDELKPFFDDLVDGSKAQQ